MNAQPKRQSQPVTPVSAVCATFAAQPSVYPPEARRPNVAPTCGSVAGMPSAEEERLRADFSRGRSRKRRGRTKPRGRARPAAVTSARCAGSFGALRGVAEEVKIAPLGSLFEKSLPFQGKRRGCTKKVRRKRKESAGAEAGEEALSLQRITACKPKTCKTLPTIDSICYSRNILFAAL